MEWPEEMIWKSRSFCSIKSKQGRAGQVTGCQKNQQGRAGQGTKKNYRAGQDTGYQNSSRAGYRLQKYLNLQSSSVRPVSLKILLLLAELAGIDNKAKANRDSRLEIIE